jgi:hypothetical protein
MFTPVTPSQEMAKVVAERFSSPFAMMEVPDSRGKDLGKDLAHWVLGAAPPISLR